MEVIGYARTSVAHEKSDSLEAQAETITAWAAKAGRRLLHVHQDEGLSGTLDPAERDGLTAALSQLQPGQGLVVHRLDRLARQLHVQEAILALVWERGGHVYSAVEGEVLRDDPDDPMRTFVRQVMGAAAQLERGLVVARLQGGRKRRRGQGRHIGGSRPYGYTIDVERELVAVPAEQRVISRIKGLRTRTDSEGRHTWPYDRIADKLNAEGVPAPGGGEWHAMTVHRIHRRVAGSATARA